MSNWFEQVRAKTDPILEAIKKHPFVLELLDGSLPREVFHFYVHQDAHYLAEYKKILALAGVRCARAEETHFFMASATEAIAVENALHQMFLKDVSINVAPSPTCELYTGFLTRIVCNHSIEEGLAALLPCYTIYQEIGEYILGQQTGQNQNPYQDWINTYGGEEFADSVKQAVAITNRYAQGAAEETLQKMEFTFERSSKMEWMFWDSAYNQEEWKI